MVRKRKIVDVYTKPEASEEATTEPPTSDEATHAMANDTEPTIEPMVLETSDTEHEPPPPPESESEEPATKNQNKC